VASSSICLSRLSPLQVPGYWPTGEATVGGRPVSVKSRVIQQGYCEYWPPNNSSCGDSPQLLLFGGRTARPFGGRTASSRMAQIFSDCAIIPESCAEYRLRLRGNYPDKDVPQYDLNIVIFDTIRYIVPSVTTTNIYITQKSQSRVLVVHVNCIILI